MATFKVYSALGIADRFGFCVNGGHGHCSFPASQNAELEYMLDRFMLDLGFLRDAGLLDALRGGRDRLGLLRHLAIDEVLDLVGVLGGLMVSVGIFFDIAVG